jgi:hypothetical protein
MNSVSVIFIALEAGDQAAGHELRGSIILVFNIFADSNLYLSHF